MGERKGKEKAGKVKAAAEKAGKAAERKAKSVERGAKEKAKKIKAAAEKAGKAAERKAKQAAKWAKEKAAKAKAAIKEKAQKVAAAAKAALMKLFKPLKDAYDKMKNMALGFIKMVEQISKDPSQVLQFCYGSFSAQLSASLAKSSLKVAMALIILGKNVALKLNLDFGNLVASAKSSFGSVLSALKTVFMGGARAGKAKCSLPAWAKAGNSPTGLGPAKLPSPATVKSTMGKKGATSAASSKGSIMKTKPTPKREWERYSL